MNRELRNNLLLLIGSIIFSLLFVAMIGLAYIFYCNIKMKETIPLISENMLLKKIFTNKTYKELSAKIKLQDSNFAVINDKEENEKVITNYDEVINLSKEMFIFKEMYGEKKYYYKPNLPICNISIWTGLYFTQFVSKYTEEIGQLLNKARVQRKIIFKTDQNGFKPTQFKYDGKTKTILFLGDSFTEGLWISPENTFVNVFGKNMKKANMALIPVNLGVNGYSVMEMTWMLEKYSKILNAKAAIFNIYYNDVGNSDPDNYTEEQIIKNFEKMFYYLNKAKDHCNNNNMKIYISIVPTIEKQDMKEDTESIFEFNKKVKDWCKAKGILCLDSRFYFSKKDFNKLYFKWDAHFTELGHEVYANCIFESLYDKLKDLSSEN
ncbi:MAG: SGNH/GDSL hydrolase family protein [Spirochaetes bacterium]|nr:SGNH/GDSL hydrolase family protein [Spirochaetota bacterium]